MYAMRTSSRSALGPSGESHQRTASHAVIAMPTSDSVYTFSFTTDCAHTVNAVAPMSVASAPPAMRCHRFGTHATSTRSAIRNHIPADTALHSAARMLMRSATFGAIGRIEKKRPRMTKNGFPGGCGSPMMYAEAMYSLVSHIAVDGDSVTMYSRKTTAPAMAAARYDGR